MAIYNSYSNFCVYITVSTIHFKYKSSDNDNQIRKNN